MPGESHNLNNVSGRMSLFVDNSFTYLNVNQILKGKVYNPPYSYFNSLTLKNKNKESLTIKKGETLKFKSTSDNRGVETYKLNNVTFTQYDPVTIIENNNNAKEHYLQQISKEIVFGNYLEILLSNNDEKLIQYSLGKMNW